MILFPRKVQFARSQLYLGIATLLLSGCGLTAETQAVRLAVAEYGAKIADAELESIEWTLCKGISVGAFTRRYGQDQKKVEAWREICSSKAAAP